MVLLSRDGIGVSISFLLMICVSDLMTGIYHSSIITKAIGRYLANAWDVIGIRGISIFVQ